MEFYPSKWPIQIQRTPTLEKMEKDKKQYLTPRAEVVECRVEKGFIISGPDSAPQLENPSEGTNANSLFN